MTISFASCGDDDNNQEEDVFAGCCSGLTAFGDDVDNLDQSQGEIIVDNLFTPNNDGFNDRLAIENIELYDNHTVTIYNINDDVIFESNNYGSDFDELFPNVPYDEFGVDGIPDGTYKYKVVVESENVFSKSGFFCLFTNNPVIEQNFSECDPLQPDEFDPLITGL
jgi:gliding motility-associated-like protein